MKTTLTVLLLSGSAMWATPASAGDAKVAQPVAVSRASGGAAARGLPGAGWELQFSPDSRYLVYGGQYSKRLPNGPLVEIAPPPACSNMASSFVITDDSQTVLFTCPAFAGTPNDLWAVPIAGPPSAAVLLSAAPTAPYELHEFYPSTTAGRVFYTMPRLEPFRLDMYSVPVGGPAAAGVVISATLAEGGQVRSPYPLTSSSRVLYHRWRPSSLGGDIWITDPDAPNAVAVGVPPASHPFTSDFRVSPDEEYLVWASADEQEDYWLYSAPISTPPGAAIQLNAAVPQSALAGHFAISPDSARVAYVANQENLAKRELFSVPIVGPGSSSVNLSAFPQLWEPAIAGTGFTPDSAWVLYLGWREVYGRKDLYGVPAGGPSTANVRINPVGEAAEEVGWYELIPDSSDVLLSMHGASPEYDLRCHRGSWLGAPGNATTLWTERFRLQGYGIGCRWAAESRGALTIAENPSNGVLTLWLAHGEGPVDQRPKRLLDASQFELNFDPFWGLKFILSPDGRYVAYLGTPLGGDFGIWALPLPFFWDGFESGGAGHWSVLQP